MTTERAIELQSNITKEAIAMLVIHGHAVETDSYEKAVRLIGKAWSLPAVDTEQCIAMLEQEKEVASTTPAPQTATHVLPESELPMNATGMQTLDNVWDLFETAVQLDNREERKQLFGMATELAECQNLLDWIIQAGVETSAHNSGKGEMSLVSAINILNDVIPRPDNPMVDRDHMAIAVAWQTVQEGLLKLVSKPSATEIHNALES